MPNIKQSNSIEIHGDVQEGYFYVCRQVDEYVLELVKRKIYPFIIAPRQVGKTSLVKRCLKSLENDNFKGVYVDLQQIGLAEYADEIMWIEVFFRYISNILDIKDIFENWFLFNIENKNLVQLIEHFFTGFIKVNISEERLFIVIDEIDFKYKGIEIHNLLLQAIHSIHKNRRENNIVFSLVGVASPELFLPKHLAGRYNFGERIEILDFDINQELVSNYRNTLHTKFATNKDQQEEIINSILEYTNGHPYLTNRIIWDMNLLNIEVYDNYLVRKLIDNIVKKAITSGSIKDPHFKHQELIIRRLPISPRIVFKRYRQLLEGNDKISRYDEQSRIALQSAGLICVNATSISIRNKIYEEIFNLEWAKSRESDVAEPYIQWKAENKESYDLPHIVIINQGGTIGMFKNEFGHMAAPSGKDEFFHQYSNVLKLVNPIYEQIEVKDGVNVYYKDWQEIGNVINNYLTDKTLNVSGIVVLHGTDTLQFTAAALAFSLGSALPKPVVFVGSQVPHNYIYGDAEGNLLRACKVAAYSNLNEVLISFNDKVFRAVHALKISDFRFDGFHSPSFPPLATIADNLDISNKLKIEKSKKEIYKLKNEFEPNILVIGQYPNLNPKWLYDLMESGDNFNTIKGVIIECLGAYNLPYLDEYSLLNFIKDVIYKDIPVVLTTKHPISHEHVGIYDPSSQALDANAIPAGKMTNTTAMVKLMWLLPQIEKDIKDNPNYTTIGRLKELLNDVEYVGEFDIKVSQK